MKRVLLVVGLPCVFALACATNSDVASSDPPDAQTVPEPDAGDAEAGDACASDACAPPPIDCAAVDFCPVAFPVSRLVALHAIWGSGPNDVWAVGSRGTLLHGDGESFVSIPSGNTTDSLVAVWGTSATDVWVMGPSSPLHSDGYRDGGATLRAVTGSSWDPVNASTGRIWAGQSAGGQVWIAGERSNRFGQGASFWTLGKDGDGQDTWSATKSCEESGECQPAIRAMWAADGSAIWGVGAAGQIFVWTGGPRWAPQDSHTLNDLDGVWGSSPEDVWAVGDRGTIRHGAKSAGTWTDVSSPTKSHLRAIWGSGPNDVWAAGDAGALIHYDGTSWQVASFGLPAGETPTDLLGIWGSGADDVWIGGEGMLLHRTSTSRRQP